jgi:hypothetical protein
LAEPGSRMTPARLPRMSANRVNNQARSDQIKPFSLFGSCEFMDE